MDSDLTNFTKDKNPLNSKFFDPCNKHVFCLQVLMFTSAYLYGSARFFP